MSTHTDNEQPDEKKCPDCGGLPGIYPENRCPSCHIKRQSLPNSSGQDEIYNLLTKHPLTDGSSGYVLPIVELLAIQDAIARHTQEAVEAAEDRLHQQLLRHMWNQSVRLDNCYCGTCEYVRKSLKPLAAPPTI